MSYNKVIIHGNLTRDPETKFTQSGLAIANIGVAVNRKWKDDAGQTKEEVTFIDATAFGKTAELLGKYFKKGKQILFDGRLKTETWDDKTTSNKRSKLVVIIEALTFVGEKGEQAQTQHAQQSDSPPAAPAPAAPTTTPASNQDDVPF